MARYKADSLTPDMQNILLHKGTQAPHIGRYTMTDQQGTYLCRLCGLALFRSSDKFMSSCGWPSFDNEIEGTIKHLPDPDGRRTEIVCARCEGHLGHVFHGEALTATNKRHCVNSLSIDFIEDLEVTDTEEAIFAAGCFWGPQKLFQELEGVVKTEVGYTGGTLEYPSYDDVCRGNTGHLEAIRVVYDPNKITYQTLTKDFFNIHNPEQNNGQGPDLGHQYLSAIFYYNDTQKESALKLIAMLTHKGFDIATQLYPVVTFWPAEEYHQHYYQKHGKSPYCHVRKNRFD